MCKKCRAPVLLLALACSILTACGGALVAPQTQPSTPAIRGPVGVRVPDPPAARTPPTSSLSGIVVSENERTPLTRARIVLTSTTLAEPRVAISGPDGRYRFAHLPAAGYVVGAMRSGYAPQEYGARPSAPTELVRLGDNENRTGIDFALASAGVITGVILDEDGKPFAGAAVEALVSRTDAGLATLVAVSSARTDDRGAFRLAGLAAGQYYVSALDPAFARVGDETGPLHYTPTFYPGVIFAEEATRVSVTPAGGAPPITITLKIVRPARVSGLMAADDRRALVSGSLVMTPVHTEGIMTIATEDVRILPDGSFVVRGVPPGRYELHARGEVDTTSATLFATYRVIVDGLDIPDVQMTLIPGAVLSGVMVVEAGRTGQPSGVRVRAPLADGSRSGDALTGDVQADGSYRILGLRPGIHMITVDGLRAPWVVKRVTYQGQDITDSGVVAESRQRFENVLVTVTDRASDLSGVVRTPSGSAAAGAMVLIIPVSEEFWTRLGRRLGVVRTDTAGRYRLRGLPPGEYRAVASLDLDESEVHRAGLLRDLSAAGIPLTLAGIEARVVDVPLISLEDLRRTSSRR
jgi:hypothetical protein